MHRSWSILLATTALLAGCSSGSSTPTTVTVTSPAPSGDSSVVTDRHPTNTDLFSSQFHPCEVFTEEQFAQAGLGKHLNTTENPGSNVQTCGFSPVDLEDLDGTYLVATDRTNRSQIENQRLLTLDWAQSGTEGIYVHEMPSEVRQCTAAIDFDWGRFLVGYRELGQGWEPEALCSASVSILESLISQAGGRNAAQD
ncbi:hypothetical protein CFAEC_10160 [Corynebacterium faecale]|uniref:DUF3558 domain-containing protein n=1 Tax=Corynebacterium faecale TaxID=1758466 RepID=UPI0025B4DE55|nr:DUF3558 domain-containing protein [Corynebacterium faecale]WJY92845.1 hypothetical protein CFAEC_10160 [Corynebacterium faecale]